MVDPTPLFPFGHGLSYAAATWGAVDLRRGPVGHRRHVPSSRSELANEADRPVAEVVQVYLHDPTALGRAARCSSWSRRPASTWPGRALGARFASSLHADLTSFTGRDLVRVVEPGAVELRVGASSADIRAVLAVRARRVLPPGRAGPRAGARSRGPTRLMLVDWPLDGAAPLPARRSPLRPTSPTSGARRSARTPAR